MSVTNTHPEIDKYGPRWIEMDDALDEQDTIQAKGEKYLPKTSGMVPGAGATPDQINAAAQRYEAYKARARYPGIVRKALTGIVGMLFKDAPIGPIDEVVGRGGMTAESLARDAARDVTSYARSVLVVDAPVGGGEPYIARYHPSCLINWKVDADDPTQFSLAVFKESAPDPAGTEFEHKTVERYRVYRKGKTGPTVALLDENGNAVEDERSLNIQRIPVFAVGSISVDPSCDPVPLLPVKDAAIAMYQLSADIRQDLHITGQKQVYFAGCSDEQYNANIQSGYGAGAAWYLGDNDKANAGLIESTGGAYKDASAERQYELDQAATHAVQLVGSSDNAESGRALEVRASTQHASIHTLAESVSIGMTQAMALRAKWAGKPEPEAFQITTEFTSQEASAQLVTALTTAINSGTATLRDMYNELRKAGTTELDYEEWVNELETSGGFLGAIDGGDDNNIPDPPEKGEAKDETEVEAAA